MKTLLAALLLLLCVSTWAQNDANVIGKSYIATVTIFGTPIDYPAQTKKRADGSLTPIPRGTIFDVIGIDQSGTAYIIEIRPVKDKGKSGKDEKKGTDYIKEKFVSSYHLVPIAEFNKVKEFRGDNGFTLGSLVMPFKLRPGYGRLGEFEFATDVTLNAIFGYKFSLNRYQPWFVTPTLSTGISVIQVDSASTFGKIADSQNLAGFSLSLGCLFEFNKIQVGMFVGSDLLSKNSKYNWINQGRPWFSIGIGYQLFTVSSPGNARQNKQQPD